LQDLQKKYGKDRERLAQEQMKLYQEAGVNPLSGCLPLLIQMPILFGLYAALVAIGPLPDQRQLLLDSRPRATPSYAIGAMAWIPEALWQAGDYATLIAYLILPDSPGRDADSSCRKWMTPTPTGDGSQAALTQNMTLIMTFFFGWFTLQVPAGLTLYWVTSNVLQMLQQWLVTRYFMRPSTPAVATAGAGNGGSAPVTIDGKADKSEKAEKAAVVPASTTVVAKPASASKQGKGKNKGK
jgi:YidC/Oxa1 family membrane protein insertase